jgi:hypothetical protein
VSEEIRCFATAIDHSFRCRSRFISVKLKPSRPRSTLWPPCCPKRCPSPNQRGKVKRGQSTILDKGLMLRTPEPELVAGRNGSADRRPGETDRRVGVSAGRRNGRSSIKEWSPRNTRKDAKGDERFGLGGPCHVARPDIGRGRDALLRDPAWHGPRNVQRQYLNRPSEWVPKSSASSSSSSSSVFPGGSSLVRLIAELCSLLFRRAVALEQQESRTRTSSRTRTISEHGKDPAPLSYNLRNLRNLRF